MSVTPSPSPSCPGHLHPGREALARADPGAGAAPAAPAPRRKSSAPLAIFIVLLALAGLGAYVVHRALHRSEALQEAATEVARPSGGESRHREEVPRWSRI